MVVAVQPEHLRRSFVFMPRPCPTPVPPPRPRCAFPPPQIPLGKARKAVDACWEALLQAETLAKKKTMEVTTTQKEFDEVWACVFGRNGAVRGFGRKGRARFGLPAARGCVLAGPPCALAPVGGQKKGGEAGVGVGGDDLVALTVPIPREPWWMS